MKDMPLRCTIEFRELVFRVGIETLAWAAEHSPELYDHEIRPETPYVPVDDKNALAADVVGAINHEEEDGSTPLSRMIDQAILYAWENGSTGFNYCPPQ